jgi:hypothetical protein
MQRVDRRATAVEEGPYLRPNKKGIAKLIIIIIIQVMESKNYERHSETITIPPAHVGLRCDNRLPIWEQCASNLVNKSGSEPQLVCTPYC